MKKTLLGSAIILFSIISCKEPPKGTISPTPVDTLSSRLTKYSVDTSQSKINWTGYKIQNSLYLNHFGTILFKEGTLIFKNTHLDSGTLIADMSSLQDKDEENPEANKKLTEHLKGTDFLDVTAYPDAVFTITSSRTIEGLSDFNMEMTGTLKLKNIVRPVSIKANVRTEKATLFLNTEKFSLNRQDFGITYRGIKDILINDNLDLQVSIMANLN
ncbi:MAG: YceI family protein [Flavobacteriaceae bacterium]|jgi:polyisoprenoid-binding protein YceI|nr:YceI family protein [Flavobacteriaceae bacterium]